MKKAITIILFCVLNILYINSQANGEHTPKLKVKDKSKILVARNIDNSNNDNLENNINVESDSYQQGSTINLNYTYSRYGFDVGVSMLNIQYTGSTQIANNNFEKTTMFNLTKTFRLDDKTTLQFGTQLGTILIDRHPRPFYQFYDVIIARQIADWLNLGFGIYHTNKDLTYSVDTTGYIGTLKSKLTGNLFLETLYLSSRNNVSGATINLIYKLNKNIQPYVGVGLAEHNGNGEYGTVGFNIYF